MSTASLLTGKCALVTGAGHRVGRAIALAVAAQGAKVAVHYHGSADGARETVAMIERAGGAAALFQANLTETSHDASEHRIQRNSCLEF